MVLRHMPNNMRVTDTTLLVILIHINMAPLLPLVLQFWATSTNITYTVHYPTSYILNCNQMSQRISTNQSRKDIFIFLSQTLCL